MCRTLAAAVALALASFGHVRLEAADGPPQPLSPEQALRRFVLPDALQIELVAAEPEIVDPVEARFDEAGRLWVVEMRDYPNPPAAGEPPKSRIKLLTDRDGDGRYETATTFVDELLFATGVQPWRGGVIATVSGKIMYFRDNDGDGVADVRETWFTGFAEENPQLRVNHPRWALDNHIYVASGLRGGKVLNTQRPSEEPIDLRSRDLRFDPLTFAAEAVTGVGQFGMTFDDFGRRFICTNRNPVIHVVLEERYLRRNPYLTVPKLVHDVAAAGPESRLYPLAPQWTTSITHANQFTAACGVHIYRGDQLADEFYGNAFTCEPTGNLVHREIIEPSGSTFKSQPAYADREFLASDDPWFRPVNVETGPDGALYVVDMYRAVIEHPQFMPVELKNRPDLRWGDDRGRIYRITSRDRPCRQASLAAQKPTPAELVAWLDHPNAWQRETAGRLLFAMDKDAEVDRGRIAEIARSSPRAASRSAALWALQPTDGAAKLNALWDADDRVAEQALCGDPGVLGGAQQRTALARDFLVAGTRQRGDRELSFSPRLAYCCALTAFPAAAPNDYVTGFPRDTSFDDWFTIALLTAPPEIVVTLAMKLLDDTERPKTTADRRFLKEAMRIAFAAPAAAWWPALIKRVGGAQGSVDEHEYLSLLTGVADGLRTRGISWTKAVGSGELPSSWGDAPFALAAKIAAKRDTAAAKRDLAIDFLAEGSYDQVGPLLGKLMRHAAQANDQALQLRALASFVKLRDPRVGPALLENFAAQPPAIRSAILDALLAQTERTSLLLDAIAAGSLKPGELGAQRVARLAGHRDAAIQRRAKELLAAALPADRRQALEKYQPALKLTGDSRQGKEVFRKNCATCHKVAGVGVDVGPSIADTYNKNPEQLLADILQPSRAIDNNFISYSVTTTDGIAYTGLIVAETPGSITLKLPEAKTVSLLRTSIDELRATGQSLMPDGLEKNINLQQMADCIAFLKGWRYLETTVPGVSPAEKQ